LLKRQKMIWKTLFIRESIWPHVGDALLLALENGISLLATVHDSGSSEGMVCRTKWACTATVT
jgi:hypothetical protein